MKINLRGKMMSNFKIIIATLLILITCASVVSAVNVDDFTFPSPLTKSGNGIYNDGTGQNILVVEYNNENKEMWLTQTDTNHVEEKENNMYQFKETNLDEYGWIEVVEKNGDKYIVVSWTPHTDDSTYQDATHENLINFNKLNNIEPVAV